MKESPDDSVHLLRMETILTGLLRYGALVASGWLAFGMALNVLSENCASINIPVTIPDGCLVIGIVLLIALPVLRVAIMMMVFMFQRDYCFAAIAGAVLIIITLGFLMGTINSRIDFL
jgi:uncharacterized membrane protein